MSTFIKKRRPFQDEKVVLRSEKAYTEKTTTTTPTPTTTTATKPAKTTTAETRLAFQLVRGNVLILEKLFVQQR